ncbi:SDR family NAD(P)-dependent oxidoreductase [Catenovulum sediminis]|uniref:SDR family oxidoreductase n=1 Tax=Catenovulum sediminis TaxID=1740262 RepID=A0ABV1RGY1_9ALTE
MSNIAIFGVARGIGRSFIKAEAGNYESIYLFDISNKVFELAAELKSIGVKCFAYQVDVTDIEETRSILESALRGEKIDQVCYLIRSKNKPDFLKITPEEWDDEFALTLKSAFFLIQQLVPHFNNGSAAVLFISSIHADLVCLNKAVTVSYHSAKAGLENLTKYLAVHLGNRNIRVNALRLGFIVQDEHLSRFYSEDNANYRANAELAHPLRRVGHTQEVTSAMTFLLSKQASFITGAILNVDGGMSLVEQSGLVFEVMSEKPE